MPYLTATQPTLVSSLMPTEQTLVRNILLAIAGTGLLYLSAKFRVPLDPISPVPLSMQTFAVLFLGMAFGWRLGAATMLLYLAEGALGLPVFAGTPEKGIGIPYLMGPTGGYLVSYVFAAGTVGYLAQRGWDRNLFTAAAAMVIGSIVIYAFGVSWLAVVIGSSLEKSMQLGMLPFLLGDAIKIALAAVLLPVSWRILRL
ncbi:MAG: biotin transporter BioY [Proteobacteria bacterium]|nr:biotin transporter BioY [Pseudomonadota bacterium]